MSDRDYAQYPPIVVKHVPRQGLLDGRRWFDTMFDHLPTSEQMQALGMHKGWADNFYSGDAAREAFFSSPIFGAFEKWLGSKYAAQWMWHIGDRKTSDNYDEIVKWNDRLYTHNPDGHLNHVTSKDLLPHFAPGHEADWPQLLLTTNHANTNSSTDVGGIMKDISNLMRHVIPDEKFDLMRQPATETVSRGKTILVTALSARESYERNGAELMYRNLHLRKNKSLESRISVHMKEGEAKTLLEGELECRGPSKASIRLGKLMLKLMAQDPSQVDVDEEHTLQDIVINGVTHDRKPAPKRIVLRPDAEAIAKHITLIGYSKSATMINDAVRCLEFDLMAKGVDGKPIVQQQLLDNSLKPLASPADIHPIIRKLGIIGINGPGVLLTDEEKACGTYRLRLRNSRDKVAGHFDKHNATTKTVDAQDVVHTIRGSGRGFGHHPQDAMGREMTMGYIQQDVEAMHLLRKVLCPKYGLELPELEASHLHLAQRGDSSRHR